MQRIDVDSYLLYLEFDYSHSLNGDRLFPFHLLHVNLNVSS